MPSESAADDGLDFPEIARDPDGRLRLDRVLTALRGVGSPRPNVVPALVVGVAGSVPAGLLVGWLETQTLASALNTAGSYVTVAVLLAFVVVLFRTENYFEGDETVAAERLQARYAAGEIDHAEFQRRVEPVLREGPTALEASDDDSAEPETILKRRFARGEIDREEYASRLAALRAPTTASGSGPDTNDAEDLRTESERT